MAKKRTTPPGKVIRIGTELESRLNQLKRSGESWNKCIDRLTSNATKKPQWTLPSKLVPTKKEALGLAIAEAARQGIPLEEREEPIKLMESP